MKILISKITCFIVGVSFILTMCTNISYAQDISNAPLADNILITNNAGARDTVDVSELSGGDVVKVYNSGTGGKILGSATVSRSNTEVTVSISQLGISAGSVYVSVTSSGESESERVKVDFDDEPKSDAPSSDSITVTNNSGMSDVVNVNGLSAGDLVKVYNSAKGGKLLGSSTMTNSMTEATVIIGQLGTASGSVFVSVTSKGERESDRVEVIYSDEPKSDPLFSDSIIITNNAGMADTVYITGLLSYDVIKVYNAAKGGKLLGSIMVPNNKTEITMTIAQLGSTDGSIYITVTSRGMSESDRLKVDFSAELKSDSISSDNINITNNALGTPDIIEITSLSAGDIIKIYNQAKGGKLLATSTVPTTGYQVSISIAQIGATSGSLYISLASKGMGESDRIQADYLAEPASDAPSTSNIIVTNNAGTPDTIDISCLSTGDIVKVYNAAKGGKLLGTATVPKDQSEVIVTISQIGASAGSIYISVTSVGENASDRTAVTYIAEAKSGASSTDNIAVTNNPSGTADTVEVLGLSAGDMIKVYNSLKGGTLLSSATVTKGNTSTIASIPQLGTSAGSIYISITNKGQLESERLKVDYAAETLSDGLSSDDITISNNAGTTDTIYASGLSSGDVINIYDSSKGGKLLASATVPNNKTEVTINIAQLGSSAGSIYVSVMSKGKNESSRVKIDYPAESISNNPDLSNAVVTNNSGSSDTVQVDGLSSGDIVNVYDSAKGGKLLGNATVPSGKTGVTVTIAQLGTLNGSVYISVTSSSKLQSGRIKVDYPAEVKTNAPSIDNISITNNPAGTSDTIDIIGLMPGDVVNVYDSAKSGKLLGSSIVQNNKTVTTVTIVQLGISSGSVYVTATNTNKSESDRVKVDYSNEPKTYAPDVSNITVANNPEGTPDTVVLTGLTLGDVVNVYDSAKAGTLLGTVTAQSSNRSVTVSINQLGTFAGSVYVSVTGKNKLESDRTKADFADESKTNAPIIQNIIIDNNAGAADTVVITGVSSGDIAKVYDTLSGGNLLGTATVSNGRTDVTVSITQISATSGSLYISLTSSGKLESIRTKADYSAEAKTDAPKANNIVVTNNAGTNDIVKVAGLVSGDTVKVYDAAKGGDLLGTGTVSTYDTTATITITQIGSDAGSIYVTVTSKGNKLESDCTKVDYSTEPRTNASASQNISIINNAGIPDVVKVIGLSSGDVIKIYDAAMGGNILGSATVPNGKTEVSSSIEQLGTNSGGVFVSITSVNKLESNRVEADYNGEAKSDSPNAQTIDVVNYAGMASTVTVSGLIDNDIINVYDTSTKDTLLGTANVPAFSTEVTVTIPQLGTSQGSIYVTVTRKGRLESDCTKVNYSGKTQSNPPGIENIDIDNNSGISDVVTVTNLSVGDVVKVYDSSTKGTVLGTSTVQAGYSQAVVTITQLGTAAGSTYVTVTNTGKTESTRTKVDFSSEQSSNAPIAGNITVINNAGMAGTVTVTGLMTNDIVKVYDSLQGGNLLGSATLSSNDSQVVVSIPQVGSSSGSVFVSVKSIGKNESSRTKVDYAAVSSAPIVGNITVVNNSGIADIVTVTGLTANDLVKVYDSSKGGNLLGSATVTSNSVQAIVSIPQLTTGAGSIYVSVTNFGKAESTRTKADFVSEQSSNAPFPGNVIISNNAGIADTITVTGLSSNDVVKVYDSIIDGTLLGTATVPSGGSQAVIKVTQLGITSGYVYVSVISLGKNESDRSPANYAAEQASNALFIGNITIKNIVGTGDTVIVTSLTANDVIKVYDSAQGGNLLGSITVQDGSTQATITLALLNSNGGSIYISVTNLGKTESDRTRADYTAER